MSSIDRSDPVILGHILAEHHDLFAQITAARMAFADPDACGPDQSRCAACHATALSSLQILREHLRSHFAHEEDGGFLEESIARMPRLAASANVILSQHPALLAEIEAVLLKLSTGKGSPAVWKHAGDEFESFATHMMAHEKLENSVIQDGYNEDLGLTD